MNRPFLPLSPDRNANAPTPVAPIDVRLVLVEERERRRIARGLHDDVGQILALVQGRLHQLKSTERSPERVREIEHLRALVSDAITATRSLTFELGSPCVHELGLEVALRSLGQHLLGADRVRFHFEAEDDRQRPPDKEVGFILYRCSRELLRNVVEHAHASNVWMRLVMRGREISLSVQDDGIGFEPFGRDAAFGPGGHYGLHSVREQVLGLGGRFDVASSPGRGTEISMTFPMHLGSEASAAGWLRSEYISST
jgi:signal transduction histidine kinase